MFFIKTVFLYETFYTHRYSILNVSSGDYYGKIHFAHSLVTLPILYRINY